MLTIVTVNFNNRDGLVKTLHNINRYVEELPIKHVIIDGGSSDGSEEVILKYSKAKPKVRCIIERDNGIYHAMNKGIHMSNTVYVAFLNSGDTISDETFLIKILDKLESDKSIDIAYADVVFQKRSEQTRIWKAGQYSNIKLLLGWMPPHPMAIIRRSLIVDVGFFDESYKIAGDYDLFLRLFRNSKLNLYYAETIAVNMEAGGASNSNLFAILYSNLEVMKSWFRLNGLLLPFWIFFTKPTSKLLQINWQQTFRQICLWRKQ
ncbi:glycosyltransferase [Planktomarina temperata]|nr:glycosyltransferase [Planktomarina temperata]